MTFIDIHIVHVEISRAADTLRRTAEVISEADMDNADPAMYGSLAGAAGNLTEPASCRKGQGLLNAVSQAGSTLADDLMAARATYQRFEDEAQKVIEQITKELGKR